MLLLERPEIFPEIFDYNIDVTTGEMHTLADVLDSLALNISSHKAFFLSTA